MYIETISLIADWLAGTLKDFAGVDRGVNSFLAGVPRLAGHALPPNVAGVEDEVRHPSVARNRVPSVSPGVSVSLFRDVDLQAVPTTFYTDADSVEVATVYVGRNVATEQVIRDGLYTGRAILRSLRWFAKAENVALRASGDVQLIQMMGIRVVPTYEEKDDVIVTAGIVSRWKVRDQKPYG